MMWSLLTAKVFLCRREPGERGKRKRARDDGKGGREGDSFTLFSSSIAGGESSYVRATAFTDLDSYLQLYEFLI